MITSLPRFESIRDTGSVWGVRTITNGYVFTDKHVTAVCYFPPIVLEDAGVLSMQLRNFVETFFLMPTGAIISSYLVKQTKDTDVVPSTHSKYEILNFLEEKRLEAVNSFPSPEYHTFISLSVPVQGGENTMDLGSLLGIKKRKTEYGDEPYVKSCREAIQTIENTISQLGTKFNRQCFRLNSKTLAGFLGLVLNHGTTANLSDLSSLFTGDIFSSNERGVTYYGGRYHACLSLRAKGFPKNADHRLPGIYYKEELSRIPFVVKNTIYLPDSMRAKKAAGGAISQITTYMQFSAFKNFFREMQVELEMMSHALDALEMDNGRLLDMSYQVLTWGETLEGLERNVRNIRNVFNGSEINLTRDTHNHKAAFHSMMPFCSHLNQIRTRITSMNAEVFLPLVYPAYYVNDPSKELEVRTLMYTGHDVLTEFDLMDKHDPSWNGIVCGGSGSGKSFFMNYLIQSQLYGNSKIFIIDKGGPGQGSFRNLVTNIPGGRYVEMKWRGEVEFSINFFDGPLFVKDVEGTAPVPDAHGVADVEKETFLIQVLTLLTQDAGGSRLTKTMEARLSEALRQFYLENGNNLDNNIDLDLFAREVLLDRFPELYNQIQKYIDSGPYARFFKKTSSMGEGDIFCFDLEGMDSHPDLAPIMMLVITRFCYSMCMQNPGVRKMIVIDEAWSALGSPDLKATVENIWRTIRKHGGFIYCVTQSYNDIVSSAISAALLNNTTHYYFLGANHDWEVVKRLKASGAFTNQLSEYDYGLIQKMKFVKGQFSEIFMMTPLFKGVLRYRASGHDMWLSTTNADDKRVIEETKKKFGAKHLTIDVLKELAANS